MKRMDSRQKANRRRNQVFAKNLVSDTSRILFSLSISLVFLLAACASASPVPASPTIASPVAPTFTLSFPTAGASEQPVRTQLFADLEDARAAVAFSFWTPVFIPGNLPLDQVEIFDYADSHQGVRLTYAYPGDDLAAGSQAVFVLFSNTTVPLDAETFRHPSLGDVRNVQETQVGGKTAYLYSTHSATGANLSHLTWQQDGLTVRLSLFGDWFDYPDPNALLLTAARLMLANSLDWQTYTSSTWPGVSFDVPSQWQPDGPDAFTGPDGFARLEVLESLGGGFEQVCEWEANAHQDVYGDSPALLIVEHGPDQQYAHCLILSADEGPSASVLLYSMSGPSPRYLALRMQGVYTPLISRSLRYQLTLPPQPTLSGSSIQATPDPATLPLDIPAQVTNWGALTIEAYPIISSSVDSPGWLEFAQRIPAAVLEKRRLLRRQVSDSRLDPVIVAGKRVVLVETSVLHPFGDGSQAQVKVDEQIIYRYNLLPYAGSSHVYRLASYADHWWLEVSGMLVMDGEIINQQLGCQEIHDWSLLNGKPFYFCVQGDQTLLNYAGETLPITFTRVFHKACCEPSVFNVRSNDQMVWFYAERDGLWYYVEVSSPPDS